jgi:hypothetical protein
MAMILWVQFTISEERAKELAQNANSSLEYLQETGDILVKEGVVLTIHNNKYTLSTWASHCHLFIDLLTPDELCDVYEARRQSDFSIQRRTRLQYNKDIKEKERLIREKEEQEYKEICADLNIDPSSIRRPYLDCGNASFDLDKWRSELREYNVLMATIEEKRQQKRHLEHIEKMRRRPTQPLDQIDHDELKAWSKVARKEKGEEPKCRVYECQECHAKCKLKWVELIRAAGPKCKKCGSTKLELISEEARNDQIRLYSERLSKQ